MAFQELISLRKNFSGPRLNFRWDIKFYCKDLMLVSQWFPARSVSFNRISIISDDVEVAPGLSLTLNTHSTITSKVSVNFWETCRKDVALFLEKYTSAKGLSYGLNSLPGTVDEEYNYIIMYINQYDTTGKLDYSNSYIVEPTGSYVDLLDQDASPYSAELEFNVLGIYSVKLPS